MPPTLRTRLKDLRAERGLTQEALADAVGVSRQTIIAIERGNYVPSLLLAMAVARRLKLRVEDVFSVK